MPRTHLNSSKPQCDILEEPLHTSESEDFVSCSLFPADLNHNTAYQVKYSFKNNTILHITFPDCKYKKALARTGLPTLYARRKLLCLDLFENITKDPKLK